MACEAIPKIDGRGFGDIMEEIARLAEERVPEWKFSPDDPDAGTALACVFARRTAETVEKFDLTPLNHRREFYNMLGAAALPAIPAEGYVRFELGGTEPSETSVGEGFALFSPVVGEQGARLVFETTRSVRLTPARIKETIYADPSRDLLCFRDGDGAFEPSPLLNANERSLRFRHELLGSLTEDCRLYIRVTGSDGERWAERLCDPALARFSRISDGAETELECFNENGAICLTTARCEEIKAEIKDVSGFEGLSFGGMSISPEGWNIKPDSVFVNGEEESSDAFYAFGEAPAVYDALFIESAAAFSKPDAEVSLSFDIGFEVRISGDIPEPVIPNRLFVRKSEVGVPERKRIAVEEVVWEYWNGTGFATLRGAEDGAGIFRGFEGGRAVGKTRVELKFRCPPDVLPVTVGAAQRLCVRARVKKIRNAYAFPSESYLPRVENVRVSYKYAEPPQVRDIVLTNNCGRLAGRCAYPFSRLPCRALYIGFDGAARDFSLLVCRDTPSDALDGAEWSVLTDGGWERAEPRRDEGLTGFFEFELRKAPTKSTIFGRTAHWLRAELPRGGDISLNALLTNCAPVIQRESMESYCSDSEVESISLERKNVLELKIYTNAAKRGGEGGERWEPLLSGWTLDRAEGTVRFSPALSLCPNSRTIRLEYACGGGAAGDLPAGLEFIPSLTDGSIRGASNPFPFVGGRDGEEAADTEARAAGELRHRGSPITAGDIAELLTGGDVASARVSPDGEGGLVAEVISRRGASEEDVRGRVRSALADMLPLGTGAVRVAVIREGG